MALYALTTLIASIWAMRSQAIDWSLIVIAIAAPLILAVVVQQRQLPRTARRRVLTDR